MTEKILVAFTDGDSGPLGDVWRLTARGTGFYLETVSQKKLLHLSVHAATVRHPDGHRFHVKVDGQAADASQGRGNLVDYNLPDTGYAFDGQRLASGAFRVARIRWQRDLQQPHFRQAALLPTPW